MKIARRVKRREKDKMNKGGKEKKGERKKGKRRNNRGNKRGNYKLSSKNISECHRTLSYVGLPPSFLWTDTYQLRISHHSL